VDELFVASGGEKPYLWSIDQGSLPAGIILDGEGSLSGISENPIFSEFTVRLTDSEGNFTDRQISLEVVEPIRLQSLALPAGVSGSEYAFQILAGGGSSPYTWEVTDGTLPEGMNFSSAGLISGVPQVATKISLTIRATDLEGRSAAFTYELEVLVGQERQTISARGGRVLIEIEDNLLKYIENTPNDGFDGYLVVSTPQKVQVHFIGQDGQIPSWVLCEAFSSGICSFD